jgi:hypothetical protein
MNMPTAKTCIHCNESFTDERADDSDSEPNDNQRINKWVEHREWVFFWGLLVDSQETLNALLLEHNKKGWKCIQVWRQAGVIPNLPIGTLILVLFVTILTLGFVQYYVGPALLMEKKLAENPE